MVAMSDLVVKLCIWWSSPKIKNKKKKGKKRPIFIIFMCDINRNTDRAKKELSIIFNYRRNKNKAFLFIYKTWAT